MPCSASTDGLSAGAQPIGSSFESISERLSTSSGTNNNVSTTTTSATTTPGITSAHAVNRDEEMINWLKNLKLNDEAVQKVLIFLFMKLSGYIWILTTVIIMFQFVYEDLTHSDVLHLMTRDDLRRLGLKAGPELRVWKAILCEREDAEVSDKENNNQ